MGKPRRETILQVLARNTKFHRLARGWSQEQLAEESTLSARKVSTVETAATDNYLTSVEKLAAAFKISESELLDRSTPNPAAAAPQVGRPRGTAKPRRA